MSASLKGAYGADWSQARPTRAQLTRPRAVAAQGVVRPMPRGVEFCCRYLLNEARNAGKALHRDEALELNSWGIPVASNFEYSVGGMLKGFAQGVADARTALAEILEMGIPRKVVYFSCDVDVSIAQIPAVLRYCEGAASVLGKENVGLYGEYDLIEAAGRAGYRWLWQCYAWSYGKWSQYATVRQIRNGAFPGEFDGDLDLAMADDIGAWSLTAQEELDMDMDTRTPPGGDTHGMTFGELCAVMVRGANAAAVARQGVADLASAFRLYIAEDASADAAVLARLDGIMAATADPVVLGAAIAGALPLELAKKVVHELGLAIALAEHPPGA